MKVLQIDHIGIAVKNLEESLQLYTEALGLEVEKQFELPERHVKISFIPCGESALELVSATTPQSPFNNLLESEGEGLYHIALSIDNINDTISFLKEKGIRFQSNEAQKIPGVGKVIFTDPSTTGNISFEFIEREK